MIKFSYSNENNRWWKFLLKCRWIRNDFFVFYNSNMLSPLLWSVKSLLAFIVLQNYNDESPTSMIVQKNNLLILNTWVLALCANPSYLCALEISMTNQLHFFWITLCVEGDLITYPILELEFVRTSRRMSGWQGK